MLKKNDAFTLIEMLIVLMIISVLVILIIPNLGKRSKEVNHKGCDALISVVQAQVDTYHAEKNRYPSSLNTMIPEYLNEEQKTCNGNKELVYDRESGKVRAPN
ncbi:competence type IV pilus major pilin ComGC [Virgibacillus proomii]|jgi:competence protein ComGC|uniref:competence type IV pilus major pilin ComGC n=1 Tax=Virgibacillus proomii TaxID=84407 RepID=UPI0009850440|nr:competence type IV pilus major pilin ComGC [Virgibacillus proomii]